MPQDGCTFQVTDRSVRELFIDLVLTPGCRNVCSRESWGFLLMGG